MACATLAEPLTCSSIDRDQHHGDSVAGFHRLLEWLDAGDESFGERYLDVRDRLVRYFDRRNRPFPDDLADETLNRVARILEREGSIEVTPPARYCYVVAKFVLLEDVRRGRRDRAYTELTRADTDAQRWPAASHDDEAARREERLASLDACLQRLSREQRDLVVGYYRAADGTNIAHRRELAQRLGISSNALAVRASRIRKMVEARMTGMGATAR